MYIWDGRSCAHSKAPVSDDDARAAFLGAIEGFLDDALAFGVEGGSRFVKEENARASK